MAHYIYNSFFLVHPLTIYNLPGTQCRHILCVHLMGYSPEEAKVEVSISYPAKLTPKEIHLLNCQEEAVNTARQRKQKKFLRHKTISYLLNLHPVLLSDLGSQKSCWKISGEICPRRKQEATQFFSLDCNSVLCLRSQKPHPSINCPSMVLGFE